MQQLLTWRKSFAVAAAMWLAASSVVALQTRAPDLTGTWTGTFTSTTSTGAPDEDPAHMVLKQNGTELTGTAGPRPDRQMALVNGKVATLKGETTATFEIAEGDAPIRFELKLVDGRLKGIAVAEVKGQARKATVDVGRQK